jgi:hypothetical protein
LTGLRGARLNPGWERVRALSIAALSVAVISGLLGWRSRPQQVAPPMTPALRGGVSLSAVPLGHAAPGFGEVWRHPSASSVRV